MKYVIPEMEIVEFDESVLTAGLNSEGQDSNENIDTGTGTDTPIKWQVVCVMKYEKKENLR